MAKDLNKVQFTGHLGGDPEMRYTAQGSAVTNFRVASNRSWKDRDGGAHEDTEWFRVVAWDKLGEICNQYLTKGTRVYIEGRLQTRKYTDREGQERYVSEVIAQDMIILSSRGERGSVPEADGDSFEEPEEAPAPARRAPAPANGGGRAPAPATASRAPSRGAGRNQPQPIESDDDIPF
ncbi:MAG TPA: single-stranded DNA-binding protein [Chloroflexaceae bacterium]|nr:single-stranded DNA-binding protein [Chloroflexaceae bacterium]